MMEKPHIQSEAEVTFTTIANFLSCVAVIVLVAGALFFIRDLHLAMAGGRSRLPTWIMWIILVGIVATQRIRARKDEIPYWPLYVVFLALAIAYRMDQEIGFSPGAAQCVMYGGIAVLWIIADKLTGLTTLDATDADTTHAGLFVEDPERGESLREVKILKHPGVGVILFGAATVAMFLLCERFVTGGSLGSTTWPLKLAVLGALSLLAITAMFSHLRYAIKHTVDRPRAFMPAWIIASAVLIALALLVASLVPAADFTLRQRATALVKDIPAKLMRSRGTDPDSDEPGERPGKGHQDDPNRRQTDEGDSRGRPGEEGPRSDTERDRAESAAESDDANKESPGDGGKETSKARDDRGREAPEDQGPSDKRKEDNAQDTSKRDEEPEERRKRRSTGTARTRQDAPDRQRNSAGKRSTRGETDRQKQRPREPRRRPRRLPNFGAIGRIIKTIIAIAIAVVVIWLLARLFRKVLRELCEVEGWKGKLAAFFDRLIARFEAWLASLRKTFSFGKKPAPDTPPPPKPFVNPFLSREIIDDFDIDEVVRYAYENARRLLDETGAFPSRDLAPYEFIEKLPTHLHDYRGDLERLTNLYVVVAYSSRRVRADARRDVERIWPRLAQLVETSALPAFESPSH